MSDLSTSERIAADWLRDGRRVVAATLVERIGSAPLDPGARMLVDDQGRIEGSVTGGCVEGALVEEAERILAGGEARIVTYGVSDEEALGVGLMCGGTVRVFVHELREDALEALDAIANARAAGEPAAMATLLDGGWRRNDRWRSPRTAYSEPSAWPSCSIARSNATRAASSTRGSPVSDDTGPAAR